jgi:hypothetical protein
MLINQRPPTERKAQDKSRFQQFRECPQKPEEKPSDHKFNLREGVWMRGSMRLLNIFIHGRKRVPEYSSNLILLGRSHNDLNSIPTFANFSAFSEIAYLRSKLATGRKKLTAITGISRTRFKTSNGVILVGLSSFVGICRIGGTNACIV